MRTYFEIKDFKIVIVVEWNFPYDIKEERSVRLLNFVNESYSNVFVLSHDCEDYPSLIVFKEIKCTGFGDKLTSIKQNFLKIIRLKQLEFRIERVIYDTLIVSGQVPENIYRVEVSKI